MPALEWGRVTPFLSALPSKNDFQDRAGLAASSAYGSLKTTTLPEKGERFHSPHLSPNPQAPTPRGHLNAVLLRRRGPEFVMRSKPCREGAGMAAKAKGPDFQSREFSSTRWMQTGPRGSTPTSSRAVRSGPAVGMQTALPRHFLPASQGSCSVSPSPLSPAAWPNRSRRQNRQRIPSPAFYAGTAAEGQATQRRRTGKIEPPFALDYRPRWTPGVCETNACRVCLPFWRSVGCSLFPALDRCKTTDSKPRQRRSIGSDGGSKIFP